MGRDKNPGYPRSMGGRISGERARSRPQTQGGAIRPKGSIDRLPSGSWRVRVYAGTDILTGKPHILTDVIPDGPDARDLAQESRQRLVDEVASDRHVKTGASIEELITEHLDVDTELAETTKDAYRANLRKHISPVIGSVTAADGTAHLIEKFKAELRRCRDHCDGNPRIDHSKDGEHTCTKKCRAHVCKPLAIATVRKNLFLISAAYESAKVWEWLFHNPVEDARVPPPPPPDPQPPSPDDAARIMNAAWRVNDWLGALVWLAMTIGARRGELCALRWSHLQVRHHMSGEHDCVGAECEWWLVIRVSRAQTESGEFDKDTKTHQVRRVALDMETVAVLLDFRQRCERIANAAGRTLAADAYMFATSADGSVPLKPRTVSQRYKRLVTGLGIATSIKMLRHYSATELLTAGVDLRTVAGRLGHGGGGTTTLKVYAAWVFAADQRAALTMLERMPARPGQRGSTPETGVVTEQERIATHLRASILDGTYPVGGELPTVKELAKQFTSTVYKAHGAVCLLKETGYVTVSKGRRAIVCIPPDTESSAGIDGAIPIAVREDRLSLGGASSGASTPQPPGAAAAVHTAVPKAGESLDLDILHFGKLCKTIRTLADPTNDVQLVGILASAVRRMGPDAGHIDDYEMVVRYAGERGTITTIAAPPDVHSGLMTAS